MGSAAMYSPTGVKSRDLLARFIDDKCKPGSHMRNHACQFRTRPQRICNHSAAGTHGFVEGEPISTETPALTAAVGSQGWAGSRTGPATKLIFETGAVHVARDSMLIVSARRESLS